MNRQTTLALQSLSRSIILCAMLLGALPVFAQVNVLTQRYDNGRSGANLAETTLNTSNVNVNSFGKLFARNVDGQIYAQPLYVANVAIPTKGTHNVVYVATEHNSVYAFDADDPTASAPLWQVNFGPSVPSSSIDCGAYCPYHDITVEVGITSTPVIDASTGTIYVVAKTLENTTYFNRLHALDITTGQEKFGGPVVIQPSVPGTGDSSANGTISFDAYHQLNRPALLLLNGVVYVAFGSHADARPCHGWVVGFNAGSLQQVAVYNTSVNGSLASIWQSGCGLTADAGGNIYFVTGNGTFDGDSAGPDLGDSVIKLTTQTGLSAADWFTPYNQSVLDQNDTDFGSGGAVLIPGTNLVMSGSKEGYFFVLNRGNMGRFQASGDTQIVQKFMATNGHIHGTPVFWNGSNGMLFYVWSEDDYLKTYPFSGGFFQTTPSAHSTMMVPGGMPGGMLAVSANGSQAGSGIVWASHPASGNANMSTRPGILRAFDASDVSKELWNSTQNATRDNIGNFAKFSTPTIANGKVYMATFSSQLVVYGLLPVVSAPGAPTNLAATPGNKQLTLTWSAPTGAASYVVQRSLTSGGPYTTLASNLVTTTYTDNGLTNGTPYYYVVAAVNNGGPSPNSSQAGATPVAAVYALNSAGPAVAPYSADADYSGGTVGTTTNAIDTSLVINPAPQAVYQSERYGNMTYTLPGLTPRATYKVRLHFDEFYWTGVGQRVFNVSINGTTVLSNFDIYAAVGQNKALVKEFTATADSSGKITIQYVSVTDNAKSSGLELFFVGAPATPTAPTGLTATAGRRQVTLKWNAVSGATSYSVKRATSSTGAYTVIAKNLTGISYTNTTVISGKQYYYVVSASNANGEGPNSSQVSTVPK